VDRSRPSRPQERAKPTTGESVRVVGVHDGDTLTALTAGNVHLKVRLVEIDAPELKQPFGQQSKQALAALVFGKGVEIRATGKDRYGRTLARVFVAGIDVNLAMVKAGMAWRFDKYSKDGAFQTAQEEARRARRGLWADAAPVAPWEWRKRGGAEIGIASRDRIRLNAATQKQFRAPVPPPEKANSYQRQHELIPTPRSLLPFSLPVQNGERHRSCAESADQASGAGEQ